MGLTLKADVPDATNTIDSWSVDLRRRQLARARGVGDVRHRFAGHPNLRNLYLPGDFEGHPLRKDFPLLARMVKPWPGIVDVEGMPGVADDEGGE